MLTVIALAMTATAVVQVARWLSRPRVVVPLVRSEAVRRMVRHIARRHIAELAEGEAAVVRGQATALEAPLIAPLTGRPCIGYHVLIREQWLGAVLVDHARCGGFTLTDGTGSAAVTGAIELAAVDVPSHAFTPPLPPALAPWLSAGWDHQPIIVSEGVLLDGAEVAVCGVMHATIGAGDHYREVETHRALTGSPSFPLVASPDRDVAEPSYEPVTPEQLWAQRGPRQ